MKPRISEAKLVLAWSCVTWGLIALAFSTGNWWEAKSPKVSTFHRCGLWEFCFNHYVYPPDYRGKEYTGCWYIFAKEFYWIRHYILPPWFIACQTFYILALILSGVTMVMTIRGFKRHKKLKYNLKLAKSCMCCTVISTLAQGLVLTIFSARATGDWQWLPRSPIDNRLSWSFGIGVIASFCTLGQCVAQLVHFSKYTELREEKHALKKKEMYAD